MARLLNFGRLTLPLLPAASRLPGYMRNWNRERRPDITISDSCHTLLPALIAFVRLKRSRLEVPN